MKGHFWCDHCDEVAFGECCQVCHAVARWVADVQPDRRRTVQRWVSRERGRELFAQVYQAVQR